MLFRRAPKILLSYRRADTEATAGRLADHLKNRFGSKNVFIDVDNIPYGKDFREHIHSTIKDCDVVIVLIGQQWLGSNSSIRRIDEHEDHLRIEIETAFSIGARVIPVLVDDATMPNSENVPASISKMSYLNAARLRTGRDFHYHLNIIFKAIEDNSNQRFSLNKIIKSYSPVIFMPLLSLWQYSLVFAVVNLVTGTGLLNLIPKSIGAPLGINYFDILFYTGALIYFTINLVACSCLRYYTKFRLPIGVIFVSPLLTILYTVFKGATLTSDKLMWTLIFFLNVIPLLLISNANALYGISPRSSNSA